MANIPCDILDIFVVKLGHNDRQNNDISTDHLYRISEEKTSGT